MLSEDERGLYSARFAAGEEYGHSKFNKLAKVAKEMLKCIDYDHDYFATQLKELGIEVDNR